MERFHRLAAPPALLFALIFIAIPIAASAQSAPRAIVLAWDGVVPSFVRELVRQGKLPNLAKLIDTGFYADDVLSVFPPATAPGFASLMTGATPSSTGITGARVPRASQSQFTILESAAGFNPALQRAETIVSAAQRSGRKVVDLHMPFGATQANLGVHFQGYAAIAGRDGVIDGASHRPRPAANWKNSPASAVTPLEISFTIGASTFYGLLIDDPEDARDGYDTMLVSSTRDAKQTKARLKPALAGAGPSNWSAPVEVRTAAGQTATSYLRLFELKPAGSHFLLYFTRPARDLVSRPELVDGAGRTVRAFIGNGAFLVYLQGALGTTIPNGGDGTAEARYLDTVAFAQHQLQQTALWSLENLPWDLFLAYTPFPDESEHLWRGHLEPALEGFRSDVGERLRPFLEQVYRTSDELLGLLMARRPVNTLLALISDHGMEATDKRLAINKVLQHAGLLVLDATGRVDLSKTKVFYPPINNGYLLINSKERKGGIVGDEERESLVRRVGELLAQIRDGERRPVTAVYDARVDGPTLGIGGDGGGDLYIDLFPGYELDARLGATDVIAKREPHGTHGFNPARASMRTIMALNGPAIRSGHKLAGVRVIDFAPTLAHLLELPALKDAAGRVLHEAFFEAR